MNKTNELIKARLKYSLQSFISLIICFGIVYFVVLKYDSMFNKMNIEYMFIYIISAFSITMGIMSSINMKLNLVVGLTRKNIFKTDMIQVMLFSIIGSLIMLILELSGFKISENAIIFKELLQSSPIMFFIFHMVIFLIINIYTNLIVYSFKKSIFTGTMVSGLVLILLTSTSIAILKYGEFMNSMIGFTLPIVLLALGIIGNKIIIKSF